MTTSSVSVIRTAPYGAAGPLVAGTSDTLNVIDTVSVKEFTINEYNRSFFPGTRLRATAVGFTDVWLEGIVTEWDGVIVSIDGDLSSGTGTYSDWQINVAGEQGQQGPIGPVGPIGPSGGPAGPTGPAGPAGSVLRNGNGVPSDSIGVNGDYYLNDLNGDVYVRESGTYAVVANFAGPAGATGSTGPTGPQGIPAVWRTGTGVPSNALGVNGDYYLDDDTGDVYTKSGGVYLLVANIIGPVGPTGPTGPMGIIEEAPTDGAYYARRLAGWAVPPGGGDVPSTRTITSGAGLTGGGDLSANRTLAVGAGTGITVNADDVALTVPIAVSSGGTGATTAAAALTSLGAAPIASPTFTGDPKAPTPATSDNDTSVATTAFVQSVVSPVQTQVNAAAPLASPALTGNPTAPTPSAGDSDTSIATTAFVQAAIRLFGGVLKYVSTTALSFLPFYGNKIIINGTLFDIPTSGIAGLANTSVFVNGTGGQNLAASTLYYVYAFSNSGTITADFSTTTHATSTTAGNVGTEIKSGNDTRSLIGMIRTNASSQFVDSVTQRFVRSWLNDNGSHLINFLPSGAATGSTSYVELGAGACRVEWLNFSGEYVELFFSSAVYSSSNTSMVIFSSIGMDGTLSPMNGGDCYSGYRGTYADGITWDTHASGVMAPSEGYHYGFPLGSVSAGAGGWWSTSGIKPMIKATISRRW